MKTFDRVFRYVHKSQNVSSLERAKREIEEMMRANNARAR